MKVAMVTEHYAPVVGGVEKHVTELASRVAALGHEVQVFTHAEPKFELASREHVDGVLVRRFSVPLPSTNYALSPALWRRLRAQLCSFDVVHAHGYHALPALQAALCKPTTLIFTPHYHGTGHSTFRKLLHPPYRRVGGVIFTRAARTIAVSPPEGELILSHFPEVAPRLTVVPNGVDQQALDAAEPFAGLGPVLLSAGRLETYKQVDKTIGALAHLSDAFTLRITGDGAARAELERQTEALGLSDRAAFLGKVSEAELYRWFRSTAVYVSMSSNEAMPVAFIECLAAGARVVASDIPAHRDLAKKTKGSIRLVALDASHEVLADAIRELSAQPVAPALIDTWDDVAARTVEIYEQSIPRSRRPA